MLSLSKSLKKRALIRVILTVSIIMCLTNVYPQERLVKILKRLTEVKHNNIVNFIDFWHDRVNNQDRVSTVHIMAHTSYTLTYSYWCALIHNGCLVLISLLSFSMTNVTTHFAHTHTHSLCSSPST